MSNIKAILPHDQALAVVYASAFKSKLTRSEAKLWAIKTKIKKIHEISLTTQKKEAFVLNDLYELNRIPFIEAIFLTGSKAVNSKTGDVDLMIITRPNTLWITRILVVLKLKVSKVYKVAVCPNIFLDTNHLKIREQNLYTAHEVLQAKCLLDRNGIHKKWLKENKWTGKYLPNAYKINQKTNIQLQYPITNIQNPNNWSLRIGNWYLLELGFGLLFILEIIAFVLQYLYQLPKQTNEKLGWGFAFFHPRKLSQSVINRYNKLCEKLS